ncbi:hypothetical protein GE300_09320 [Rhodobacteraceae bacterium 2CG4]|uniref:Uncharacterized protein n=1 Tax=Halovulum marinum TaxID=2662447 RepID=A0A6L5YZU3_9RHOB|nr:DUF6524 family protein [Halovulum marinum]MSU89813.1 hypothetical protein [Halovulum marinum]
MGRAFLIRWAAALALVLLTYNPAGFSYVDWVRGGFDQSPALKVLIGLLLFVAYVIYLRATVRSIGIVGIGLVLAIIAALIWVLIEAGIVSVENPSVMAWLGLITLSVVMGVGLSWSIIRRRLSGQLDVDDVEETSA